MKSPHRPAGKKEPKLYGVLRVAIRQLGWASPTLREARDHMVSWKQNCPGERFRLVRLVAIDRTGRAVK